MIHTMYVLYNDGHSSRSRSVGGSSERETSASTGVALSLGNVHQRGARAAYTCMSVSVIVIWMLIG